MQVFLCPEPLLLSQQLLKGASSEPGRGPGRGGGHAGTPARPAKSQSPAAKPASSRQDGEGDPLWKGQSISSDPALKELVCVLPLELRVSGIRERYAHEGGCAGTRRTVHQHDKVYICICTLTHTARTRSTPAKPRTVVPARGRDAPAAPRTRERRAPRDEGSIPAVTAAFPQDATYFPQKVAADSLLSGALLPRTGRGTLRGPAGARRGRAARPAEQLHRPRPARLRGRGGSLGGHGHCLCCGCHSRDTRALPQMHRSSPKSPLALLIVLQISAYLYITSLYLHLYVKKERCF